MPSSLDEQLNHPLYKRAFELWNDTRLGQIKKASEKYPEPLNHKSWTAAELIRHGIMENVDQLHYYICLLEKIEDTERKLREATERAEKAEKQLVDLTLTTDRERRKWASFGR